MRMHAILCFGVVVIWCFSGVAVSTTLIQPSTENISTAKSTTSSPDGIDWSTTEESLLLNIPDDYIDVKNQVSSDPPATESLVIPELAPPELEEGNQLFSSEKDGTSSPTEDIPENIADCPLDTGCLPMDNTPPDYKKADETSDYTTTSTEITSSSSEASNVASNVTSTESVSSSITIPPTSENHIPVENPKAKENVPVYPNNPATEFKDNDSLSYQEKKVIESASKPTSADVSSYTPATSQSSTSMVKITETNGINESTVSDWTSDSETTTYDNETTTVPGDLETKPSFNDDNKTRVSPDYFSIPIDSTARITKPSVLENASADVTTVATSTVDVMKILSSHSPLPTVLHFPLDKTTSITSERITSESLNNVTKPPLTFEPVTDSINRTTENPLAAISPEPKLTNPHCAMLPLCVKTEVISQSVLCASNRDEEGSKAFRAVVGKAMDRYTKLPVHPSQIVLELQECSDQLIPPSVVLFYLTDSSGEYDEALTAIAGILLRKLSKTPAANELPLQIIEAQVLEKEDRLFSREVLEATPPPLTGPHSGIVAAVAISAVAGACLCLLCVLLLVMRHRLATQQRQPQPHSQAIDNYSLDSFSINASFRRRLPGGFRNSSFMNHAFVGDGDENEVPTKPLSASALASILNHRRNILEQEFERIPMNMHKLDDVPVGAECKNRYANVVPNPKTRVLLSDKSEDPVKSYINANYVKGHGGRPKIYIACQAPLPEYTGDFWRMVWEQQSRLILMLTLLQENGVNRCATYFPESTLDCRQLHGNYEISLVKKDVREFYTASTLKLYDIEKKLFREVLHLWYKAWLTADVSSLVAFLLQARPFINCNSGPTIVHCSAGTGRTGVVIALDICMREYEGTRCVDVLRCLSKIRKDRGGAVQNKEQYLLIHEALLEYAALTSNQSNRPSVCSES